MIPVVITQGFVIAVAVAVLAILVMFVRVMVVVFHDVVTTSTVWQECSNRTEASKKPSREYELL